MQNQARDQVIKAIKEASNVLVTVKNGPTVDELAAAIALTLLLNRMNKHAITVFSGRVPSMLEFLQPEMAIDTNTDSLRDFIIALDKSKADKLRYKVEDNVVRIFITPYKTSITDRDLEFSQGDFNVDVVVALGVVTKDDFDQAVTMHGRILHDATVVALTNQNIISQIGAVNWQQQQASSISEMIASITDALGEEIMDGQIATALMTGIVAETDRFRNSLTTPEVMNISARLMSHGANQQLIAEKLETPEMSEPVAPLSYGNEAPTDDGALAIAHSTEDVQNIHIDDHGNLGELAKEPLPASPPAQMYGQPESDGVLPSYGQQIAVTDEFVQEDTQLEDNARTYMAPSQAPRLYGQDDSGSVSMQPLMDQQPLNTALQASFPSNGPAFDSHHKVIEPLPGGQEHGTYGRQFVPPADVPNVDAPQPYTPPEQSEQKPADAVQSPEPVVATPTPAVPMPVMPGMPESSPAPAPVTAAPVQMPPVNQTLADLEQSVGSPHATEASTTNSGQVDDFLGSTRTPVTSPETTPAPAPVPQPEPEQEEEQKDENLIKIPDPTQTPPQVINPDAPPEVPPPLMPAPTQPQFYDADGNSANPFSNPN